MHNLQRMYTCQFCYQKVKVSHGVVDTKHFVLYLLTYNDDTSHMVCHDPKTPIDFRIIRLKWVVRILAGLQSNSSLWIDDVCLSVRLSTFWLTFAFKFWNLLFGRLQSNSGLWINDIRLSVRPSINILVNLCVLSFGICFAIQPYRLQRFLVGMYFCSLMSLPFEIQRWSHLIHCSQWPAEATYWYWFL